MLIANRGEIAVRVARTLRERGIQSVAVFHDVDRGSPHVLVADRAVELVRDDPRSAYLDPDLLIEAARTSGAGAVHPGYGFLAEQSRFARACEASGLVFLGPTPETLESVGDKRTARAAAEAAGVPVIPGWEGTAVDSSGEPSRAVRRAASQLGYPMLLKAALGGGGKGMRNVESEAELEEAVRSSAREAKASFGDPSVYLERRIEAARHIEVQIVGDGEGSVVHLLERECSLQRRHQKVIEEAPGAAVDSALRSRLVASAKAIAAAVRYRSAGTIEFLVDPKGKHYFLEVNARIQVEHPVTELVTGADLVGLQLDIALGEGLPKALEPASPHGHAIEARLYAEDPAHDFLPQSGRLAVLQLPSGPGIRVDSGVREGDEIGVHFDPLIAKICAWGADRESAIRRLARALSETRVAGLLTNLPFLREIVAHPAFTSGALDTTLLEREIAPTWRRRRKEQDVPDIVVAAAALAVAEGAHGSASPRLGSLLAPGDPRRNGAGGPRSPWTQLTGFRLGDAASES